MDATEDVALPRMVQLAWGLGEEGSRGPKRGLTLDEIVDAAIALADEEGVAALSMSRVAKRLGFTTMSLYRYVQSKDELLELIADRVVGSPPEIPADLGWREGLELWARAEYDVLMQHRWWLRLPITGAPFGPNNMAWLEAALRCLGSTGLPEPLKVKVALNVSVHVIGRARFTADLQVDSESDSYSAVLSRVLDPARFPALLSAVRGGGFSEDDVEWQDADFRFALTLVLDGVERLVRQYEPSANRAAHGDSDS
ncbi:TetR/AcrR family transcriptional regulator [Prescottella soli]|uniref:TetR/AcrR family transcriptional regulator n=1 Tax=Prescottella soli TaxID=1543852 RepID=A0ABW9FU79_9NOCA